MEWKEKPVIEGKFTNVIKSPVAAEIFSAGWCNLNCNYCYIAKDNEFLKKIHQKIINSVQNGKLLENVYEAYGENLTCLSHWGTEPSLTLPHFHDFYKKAFKIFPKLDTIKWSSNFMTPISNTIDFIKSIKDERRITIDIQVSLDGPPIITDENRRKGNSKLIVENFIKMVEELQKFEFNHQISFHFKPTIAKHQYQWVIDNIYDYYKYFDDVLELVISRNKKRDVKFLLSCDPTIVCPQDYTKKDGIRFHELYKKQMELREKNDFKYVVPENNYYMRFKRLKYLDEFFTKQRMFTCSAGDSQYGIDFDGNIFWCHDHYYHKYDEYKKSCETDHSRLEENSTDKFDLIRKNHINNLEKKEEELIKKQLVIRNFHDFAKLKVATGFTLIKELERCGLVSETYRDDKMAELLSIYCCMAHSCPTNLLERNGSYYVPEIAYYKLFGNDIFLDFVKRYKKENE